MPSEHAAVHLRGRPDLKAGTTVHLIGVGDSHIDAQFVEAPSMKRTDDLISLDHTSVTEMGAKMRAVGVDQHDCTAGGAPTREFPAEVPQREHLAGNDLCTRSNVVP